MNASLCQRKGNAQDNLLVNFVKSNSLSFLPPWQSKLGLDRLHFAEQIVKLAAVENKKGKRKVQGVPQSQTAALFRPQEEEETDKSNQAQTEQTYEKH